MLPPAEEQDVVRPGVARSLEIAGHETAGSAHVGDEMMRVAVAVVPDDSDAGVSALVARGEHREAIATCARDHGAVIGRLCMALLGSQADADEATQETLLRAHRGMAMYRGEGSVKAWLCGIARHVCAHLLESRRRGRALLVAAVEPDGADAIAARRRARSVRRALDRLKPSEREALVLRYVAELSCREIADVMSLDEAAARKRISRALANLRAAMPAPDPDQEI